jgi:small subunit ribosomal protein S16
MLMLRLQRIGKSKSPSYRLIVSDKHKDTQAGYLELLGTYNSVSKPKVVKFNAERIKYWLSVGAQASNTVHNLLLNEGIISGKKRLSVKLTERRKKKLEEKKTKAAA